MLAPHQASPKRGVLFDRVGGFDGIDRAVTSLLERVARDPLLSELVPPGSESDARWNAHLLLSDLLGGQHGEASPEPAEVARRLGLDHERATRLLGHVVAAFMDTGCDSGLATEIATRVKHLEGKGPPRTANSGDPRQTLIALAEQYTTSPEGGPANLLVVDKDLTVVHVSDEAARAALKCDADLRRAFNLGAGDLTGASILRFYSAPTQLHAALTDPRRSSHSFTWSFGRTVWKARFTRLLDADGRHLGHAIVWDDESEAHHAQAVFRRLRAQAEDLPVPVMFPGTTPDKWLGNAACEHSLARLAPYLPHPVNPLDGVPISIFFPDPSQRERIFSDPALLPHKEQLVIGPETIAMLVTAVFDQDQHFLGPQLTWEIVHRTQAVPPPAAPAEEPTTGSLPPRGAVAAAAAGLREEAQAMESAITELQVLSRLLHTAADEAEGQSHLTAPPSIRASVPDAVRLAETAVALLAAVRESQPPGAPRGSQAEALEALTAIARRTNQMALDAALHAAHEQAVLAAGDLLEETRAFAEGLRGRVEALTTRTEASAEVLRRAVSGAAHLEQLRTALTEGPAP